MNSNIDILNDLDLDIENSLELIKNEAVNEPQKEDILEDEYLLLKKYLNDNEEKTENKKFFSFKNVKISFSFLAKYVLTSS
jgi:hypothetical protein